MAGPGRRCEERLRVGAPAEAERGLRRERDVGLVAPIGGEELPRGGERAGVAADVDRADRLVAQRVARRVGGPRERRDERAREERPGERRERGAERGTRSLGDPGRERRGEARRAAPRPAGAAGPPPPPLHDQAGGGGPPRPPRRGRGGGGGRRPGAA